jgi:hypothetical protein
MRCAVSRGAAGFVLATTVLCAPPAPAEDAGALASGRIRRHVAPAPLSIDCPEGACPELVIDGDAPSVLPGWGPAPFRGFGDPSVRRDPASGRLWMAYSWLHVSSLEQQGGQRLVAVVDIHLAHSDDGGGSWAFGGALWTSEAENDPVLRVPGFSSHEVVNLAFGDGTWYAVRLRYFTPKDGRLYSPKLDSIHLRLAQAPTPELLGEAAEAVLGGVYTAPGWGIDVNLAGLDPELAQCSFWNEPALHFDDGTLYLETECSVYAASGAHLDEKTFTALFAAEPEGDVRSWEWRYLGTLAGHREAVALGGENLTQTDLVRGRDGALLAVVTPNHWDSVLAADVHHGCRVVEVAALDPPALRTGGSGQLVVRATLTASDLVDYGTAGCTYEPSSATGVLLVRRQFSSSPPEMVWTIHRTGLRP